MNEPELKPDESDAALEALAVAWLDLVSGGKDDYSQQKTDVG